ncbi:MAG: peptidoglycan bridge formation glycyltransferase FemA/FemB family protein [Parcubacteria group bacterium]|nr:peptidoglycan bridge formation glycyltransferase FemA/FemB family protein [Parcubacteria group bacterium]
MWQEVRDQNKWNGLVGSQAGARFLQSWEWGEFQKSLDRLVVRLSWNGVALVQAIRMPLPLSKYYWYIPHGPVIVKSAAGWPDALKEKLNDGALFVRVDPTTPSPPPYKGGGGREVSATQPQCTAILDLSQSEDALLGQMRQKTRYNIRLAEKKGVEVGKGSIENFLRLNHEAKMRDRFSPHTDEYYQAMVTSLPSDFIRIWQATYQNEVIASNIVVTYGDTATYTHGASQSKHREVMGPHVLHWRIMQDAKKQGIKRYDLWGANPEEQDHPAYKKSWEGISRFKAGFGGKRTCYPNSFDVIFEPWLYTMYTFVRNIRRSSRSI